VPDPLGAVIQDLLSAFSNTSKMTRLLIKDNMDKAQYYISTYPVVFCSRISPERMQSEPAIPLTVPMSRENLLQKRYYSQPVAVTVALWVGTLAMKDTNTGEFPADPLFESGTNHQGCGECVRFHAMFGDGCPLPWSL
jgi:hypothetical protein